MNYLTLTTDLIKKIAELRIVKWFFTVGIGLVIDLSVFFLLTNLSLHVFLSSLFSSGLAITFVYVTSIRFVFKDKNYALPRYVVFVVYYACSISFFSYLISLLVYEFSILPLIAKILTLPASFLVNYYFASKIV